MKDLFCKIFKNNEPNEQNETATDIEKTESEEWIWVDGYKGTKEDMTCNGYQYELGKRHDMPVDADIEECCSGFHLCLKLRDVFCYYDIENDHRFFKVRALVRKADVAKYGHYDGMFSYTRHDKLVSKSIEFISECTVDDILSGYNTEGWSDEDKQRALKVGPHTVTKEIIHRNRVAELLKCGYSIPFSEYIADSDDKFTKAIAVASQPDVSMDVKVLAIFCGNN